MSRAKRDKALQDKVLEVKYEYKHPYHTNQRAYYRKYGKLTDRQAQCITSYKAVFGIKYGVNVEEAL